MKGLSSELIAILTVGVALSGVVLTTTGRLGGRLDELDARLHIVERSQSLLLERTEALDTRLKVVADGQATIRADVASVGEEMASLREEQAALRSDFAGLGERVARVEGLLEGLHIALDQRLPPAAE